MTLLDGWGGGGSVVCCDTHTTLSSPEKLTFSRLPKLAFSACVLCCFSGQAVATTAGAAPAVVALHSEKIACAYSPVALDSSFCLELIRDTLIDD